MAQLASDSKFLFYPTDDIEVLRMLNIIGKVSFKNYAYYGEVPNEIKEIIPKNILRQFKFGINMQSYSDNTDMDDYCFEYFLNNGMKDEILKYFVFKYNTTVHSPVIADLFSGKGDWLYAFKKYFVSDKSPMLIGCEIEEGRYKEMKKKADFHYHAAFEEIDLPKEFCSLMLFNPPYGESNGERNVKRYLNMIIEKQYISRSKLYQGQMIAVIRKDDLTECLPIILSHFEIHGMYKVNDNEYEKYKQYVVYMSTRKNPLSSKNVGDNINLKSSIQNWLSTIEREPLFSIGCRNYLRKSMSGYFPEINVRKIITNYKVLKDKEKYISNPNDKAWSWIKDKSYNEELGLKQLVMPRQPKASEIANIIASGYINSEISEDGLPKHIAIGGVHTLTKQEESRYNNDDGESIVETKTIRQSIPYLNIMYSKDGKLQIKQLGEIDE